MSRQLGAILLILGVTVGATALALPISLAQLGFPLTCVLFLLIWSLTLYSALLTVEVNFWFPAGANFVTMAEKSIGRWAAVLTWIFYVLFLYAFIAAYVAGGTALLGLGLKSDGMLNLPHWLAELPWVFVYGAILFFRFRSIDIINRILVFVLLVSLVILFVYSIPSVKPGVLMEGDYHHFFSATPIVFTAFLFQFLIPSLRSYLGSNSTTLRKVIFIGILLALLVYVLWVFILFAIIPTDEQYGFHLLEHNKFPVLAVTQALQHIMKNTWIASLVDFFGVLALATTFVGVSISLFDFLADSLNIVKNVKGKFLLITLVLVPPYIYTLFFPDNLLENIFWTGMLSLVLYCLMPIVMVWYGRYVRQLSFGQQTWGGRPLLLLCAIVLVLLIYGQLRLVI